MRLFLRVSKLVNLPRQVREVLVEELEAGMVLEQYMWKNVKDDHVVLPVMRAGWQAWASGYGVDEFYFTRPKADGLLQLRGITDDEWNLIESGSLKPV